MTINSLLIRIQRKSTKLPVTMKTSESGRLLGFLLKDMHHLLMVNTLTMKKIS